MCDVFKSNAAIIIEVETVLSLASGLLTQPYVILDSLLTTYYLE